MVSALIPTKRVEVGIEAVSRIPDAQLVVAGDGPLREGVDKLAACLLPGRFSRLTVSPEQMPELYRAANVFLHLSKDESFGNVFLEAMACGLPVVGHDSSRLRWIVGDGEFLLDTNDTKAIAARIQQACQSSGMERQARMGIAANFSWKKVGAAYREFLQEVVDLKRSTRL